MELMNRKFNLLESPEDDRDFSLNSFGIEVKSSGDDVSVELELPNFRLDQGQSDMCGAFSTSVFLSMINDKRLEFSQCDLYANKGSDGEGTYLRNLFKSLRNRGANLADVYNSIGSYDECRSIYESNKSTYDFLATAGRINHYFKINTFDEVVETLKLNLPIVCGIKVYENFVPRYDGMCPVGEGNLIGGHALLIYGAFSVNGKKYVKILNSWGSDWGIDGTAILPFEMVLEMWSAIDAPLAPKDLWLEIGKDYYILDNKRIPMDVAPMIKENRTFIPVRFVAEALGAKVTWYDHVKRVNIKI